VKGGPEKWLKCPELIKWPLNMIAITEFDCIFHIRAPDRQDVEEDGKTGLLGDGLGTDEVGSRHERGSNVDAKL